MVATEKNQNVKKFRPGECKDESGVKPSEKSCQNIDSNTDFKADETSTKPYRKSLFFRLSLANIVMGLANISIGIAILSEGSKLLFWVTKSAFSVWFGCSIFSTGVSGVLYSWSKSKRKSQLHVWLNLITFILTLISFGCYGSAAIYYHDASSFEFVRKCNHTFASRMNNLEDFEDCKKKHQHAATLLTILYGFLLAISIAEIIVSFLLLICCSASRKCCKKLFMVDENPYQSEYAYPGCPYGPTTTDLAYSDYHLDPSPLRPACHKFSRPVERTYSPCKKLAKQPVSRKRPQFKAMESITESIESTETECEHIPHTRASDVLHREKLNGKDGKDTQIQMI